MLILVLHMSNNSVNVKLAEKINEFVANKLITKEQLADLLCISKDSLFRRLRGETDFSLNDAVAIAHKFNVSIDAMYAGATGQIIFRTKEFASTGTAVDTVDKYVETLVTDFKQLQQAKYLDLYYAAKDLPLFCFFAQPLLTSFKLYFWHITLFGGEAKRQMYNPKWLPKSTVANAALLYQMYQTADSIEIWNFETINSTLHQILYCIDTGLVTYIDAHDLLNAMDEFVDELGNSATVGKKDGKGKLTMYLNEILLLDNSVLFDIGIAKVFYQPYQTLNFINTSDVEFTNKQLQWFQKQLQKSTIISSEQQKDRDRLMNHYKKEIQKYRSKIGEE